MISATHTSTQSHQRLSFPLKNKYLCPLCPPCGGPSWHQVHTAWKTESVVWRAGGRERQRPSLSFTTADRLSPRGKGKPKTVSEKWGSRTSMLGKRDLGLAKYTYARIQPKYCVSKSMERKDCINTFSAIPSISSPWAREQIHCFHARRSYLLA